MHYIKEGTLKNRLLALKSMEGSCTGDRIRKKIESILQDFDRDLLIDDPMIVTDRGSNMIAAFSGLNTLSYVNHLVHNVIGKVVEEVPELLEMYKGMSSIVDRTF
ncbi:hypothetical protein ACLKA6_017956 [Drosophila palustris]